MAPFVDAMFADIISHVADIDDYDNLTNLKLHSFQKVTNLGVVNLMGVPFYGGIQGFDSGFFKFLADEADKSFLIREPYSICYRIADKEYPFSIRL